jgi:DNA-binding NtrC family response regulator
MKILVVDDEKSLRVALMDELTEAGYEAEAAVSGEDAMALLAAKDYDLVITDLIMGKTSGIDLLNFIKARDKGAEVLLITAHATVETAREALKKGALDYFTKPFEIESLLHLIKSVKESIRLKHENEELKSRLVERNAFKNIIGKSPAMQKLFQLLELVTENENTVLITGETGTGKDLLARAVHYNGPRKDGPFVTVSCAALSRELLESELFGHEKGSFTGAVREQKGRFEMADGGTIFLDDVDDIPMEIQVKLLRFIESAVFERVGSGETHKLDVRIIAATKRDLRGLVEEGKFRRDLFYRLNVIQIRLPPLRERKEDIPLLIGHFLKKYAPGKTVDLSAEIREILVQYDWDGNVRELEHTIERLVILGKDGMVDRSTLTPKIRDFSSGYPHFSFGRMKLPDYLADIEKQVLRDGLSQSYGSKTKTAETLGIPLPTLKSKLKKYGM